MTDKRVGYHRISDDSVTSFTTPTELLDETLIELQLDDDIDHYWTRNDRDVVDFDSKTEEKNREVRKEYTIGVEIRFNQVYVTRAIEGITAPFTKWDFLSQGERVTAEMTPFSGGTDSCSKCGEHLATEADFAKHYIIPEVRYFNLGDCKNNRRGIYDGE